MLGLMQETEVDLAGALFLDSGLGSKKAKRLNIIFFEAFGCGLFLFSTSNKYIHVITNIYRKTNLCTAAKKKSLKFETS